MAIVAMASYVISLAMLKYGSRCHSQWQPIHTQWCFWYIFQIWQLWNLNIFSRIRIQLITMSRRARLSVAIAAYLVLKEQEDAERTIEEDATKTRKRRRMWVREWIEKRSDLGFAATLYEELKAEDPKMYKNFVRLSAEDFHFLLEKVSPIIQKQDTTMRKAISAQERLLLTLRYLATGDSYRSLMFLFRIPANTISTIIPEVCDAIFNVLKDDFMKVNIKDFTI